MTAKRRNLIERTVSLPLDQLSPHPMNARRGDVDMIVESLSTLGQYRTVVVNEGTLTGRPLEILAGHHVVQAARQLGDTELLVNLVDVTDETAKKIMLMDNRANDVSGYDQRALAELLASLDGDLLGTGFDAGDQESLEALLREHAWETGEDDLQEALDEADMDGWPEIRVKVAPPLHRQFLDVLGADDAERVANLVNRWWETT